MKIKSLIIFFLGLSISTFAQTADESDTAVKTAETVTKTVDADMSSIKWTGQKVLGSHEGTINLSDAELLFSNDLLVGGSFSIDMTTLTNTDLDGDSKANLEGHLKSPDFFDVANNPMAKFVITNVASKGTPGDYKVSGDLTIKGITNPIKFYAKLMDGMAKAELNIDRTDYNVRYGSGSFFDNLGDKTIYDEFILNIDLKY